MNNSNNNNIPYHIPALLQQTLTGLDIRPTGCYVDVTFGGGGHSRAILEQLGSDGHLYSFDRDSEARANAPDDDRFTFVLADFRYLTNFMRFHDVDAVDGILADLGVSFHHFDDESRGFSFRADAPLDMRMNREGGRTAAEILAGYSQDELTNLFRLYTDLKRPHAIAEAIVRTRGNSPVETTMQLRDAVSGTINPRQEKKDLAQVFQALRIEVNGELDSLRRLLESSLRVLKPGGRLAIITYHSIEDRLVKNFMKTGNFEGNEQKDFYGRISTPWKLITRTPIVPDAEEIERNPRSRSAKLRIAEKVQN